MFDSASWRCPYCDDGVIYCADADELERSVRHHIEVMHSMYAGVANFNLDPKPLLSEEYMRGVLLTPADVRFLNSIRVRWNPPAFYGRQLKS